MVYFTIALVIMGIIFFALWRWRSDPVVSDSVAALKTLSGVTQHEETTKQAPAATERPLQGPSEGEIVRPPTRDVTPNFQLSPLHQATPLERAAGSPLPPPPKLEPLPPIFRQVIVKGATKLELVAGRNRKVAVSLAHLLPLDEDRTCWFGGREVRCSAVAKTALQRFIRRRALGCDFPTPTDNQVGNQDGTKARSDLKTGTCYLGAGLKGRKAGEVPKGVTDIATWLVRYGWVEPEAGFYQSEREEAIKHFRGIHATRVSSNDQESQDRQKQLKELSNSVEQSASTIAPASDQTDGSDDLTLMNSSAAPQ